VNYRFATLILLVLLNIFPANAQMWRQNDNIFNPSGIPSVTFSAPRFADLDNNSTKDMILGGIETGLIYLINDGSASSPHFSVAESNPFQHISVQEAEIAGYADMDGDDDIDMICGGYVGLTYYKNNGTSQNPCFEKKSYLLENINIGHNPVPALSDISDSVYLVTF